MTFNRKMSLPKGAVIVMNNDSKPLGFDRFNPPSFFAASLNDNVMSEFTAGTDSTLAISTNTENVGEYVHSIEFETFNDPSFATVISKTARKSGVYKMPISVFIQEKTPLGVFPVNRYVTFEVGVLCTPLVITDFADIEAIMTSPENRVSVFSIQLSYGGIDEDGSPRIRVGHSSFTGLVEREENLVKDVVDTSDVYPSGGQFLPIDYHPSLSLIVDCDNHQIRLESDLDHDYRISHPINTRSILSENNDSVNYYLYTSFNSYSDMFAGVCINNDDILLSANGVNTRPKTNGFFMQDSPLYLVKK